MLEFCERGYERHPEDSALSNLISSFKAIKKREEMIESVRLLDLDN